MASSLSRMPAVSLRRTTLPSSTMRSLSTSRVVPGMSVTMARSALNSAFISEDLPTFGRPHSTTDAPSRSIRARLGSARFASSPASASNSTRASAPTTASSTSSGKSTAACMRLKSSVSFSTAPVTKPVTPPLICLSAARRAASPCAPISCITASAPLRSMRPFS